jgi:hypothetical protein
MHLSATCRWTLARTCVVLSSLLVALGSVSSAQASCGDYLVHGSMSHELPENQWLNEKDATNAHSASVSYSIIRQPSDDPARPKSSCEGGRCQSPSVPPPVDHTRISIPRQPALIVFFENLNHGSGDDSWPHPLNGLMADAPFCSVPSPPPRLSFSVA